MSEGVQADAILMLLKQESEPVAWITECQCIGPTYGNRMYGELPVQSLQPGYYKHIPLYERPPKPAPLPQPVADLAHELWAAAQLAPGEGIEDGVARLEAILQEQPVASVSQGEQAIHDAMATGIGIMKDGKRIAPKDFYVQPVSQGLEEFISEHRTYNAQAADKGVVPVDDLRTWMAGHARVPVELLKEKPLPDLMMAEYHEAKGWNECVRKLAASQEGV